MNKQEFENFVKAECTSKGIAFLTNNEKQVLTLVAKQECSGFFEENPSTPPTLGIAGGLDPQLYFEILSHEYSHSQQFLENIPEWNSAKLSPEEIITFSKMVNRDLTGFETGDVFQLWLDREIELENSVVDSLVERITSVEFDCEKRTIELIKKLNLDVPVDTYAQKANAYLYAYYFARKERKWAKGTYANIGLYSNMPTVINKEFCKNVTEELLALTYKYCTF